MTAADERSPPPGVVDPGAGHNDQGGGADRSADHTTTKAWMPLWIGDYLADTAALSTEQHGAYLLILMAYWRAGPPADDDGTLARITRLPIGRWRKHRPVLEAFFTIENGRWIQKRIDTELARAAEHREIARERGRKAAKARWNRHGGNASSNA